LKQTNRLKKRYTPIQNVHSKIDLCPRMH